MRILSIETSCDETSLAVLSAKKVGSAFVFETLAHEIHSQAKIHAPYGGVFPNLAKREHAKTLTPLLHHTLEKTKLLKKGKINFKEKKIEKILEREKDLYEKLAPFLKTYKNPAIDLITVTVGPGLEPALWVGISFAKALKEAWGIPVFGVNHMEGHVVSVITEGKKKFTVPKIQFPFLSLLVSGGHTELVLIKKFGSYKIIGSTKDDAAGEAFDKVARMLSLSYPGGPQISKCADRARKMKTERLFTLPRPMLHSDNFDFSFSGLKTAVLYTVKGKNLSETEINALCREFEDAVIDVLVQKTIKAAIKNKVNGIIIGGGVSANNHLRKTMQHEAKRLQLPVLLPSRDLTGDNALMIGIAGYMQFVQNKKSRPLKADGNLRY